MRRSEYLQQDKGKAMIAVQDVSKSFTLHNQGGAVLPVMAGAMLDVGPGECVGLVGASGAGKSTLMRMIWGNYRVDGGSIRVAGVELAGAEARDVIALRRGTLGYVSQFLRVVPRVPTLDVVAEPLLTLGIARPDALARAGALLTRLNIPQRLWALSPTTFSGGEQQRVNIARGFIHDWPVMLLDEPTASLDAANRAVVLDLIMQAKACGAAILGIFHDEGARAAVCDRLVDVTGFTPR
jgi:alpha-D-ribose 1-methylphosphonate 5-triphosphate synthase subunit PhnL